MFGRIIIIIIIVRVLYNRSAFIFKTLVTFCHLTQHNIPEDLKQLSPNPRYCDCLSVDGLRTIAKYLSGHSVSKLKFKLCPPWNTGHVCYRWGQLPVYETYFV